MIPPGAGVKDLRSPALFLPELLCGVFFAVGSFCVSRRSFGLEAVRHMTRPAGLILRVGIHPALMARCTVLSQRGYAKILKGTVALITRNHANAVQRSIPLFVQLRCHLLVALSAGDVLFARLQFRVLCLFCSLQGKHRQNADYKCTKKTAKARAQSFHIDPPFKRNEAPIGTSEHFNQHYQTLASG